MTSDTSTGSNDPRLATDHQESFAETALKLGGKSADEARRTGVIDSADDNVESLFKPEYQTTNSPAHRAVWDRGFPVELFQSVPSEATADVRKVMDSSIGVVQRHRADKTLLDEQKKITDQVLDDLAGVGYWGLLVDREYGGSGAEFRDFAPFLTRMAMADPTVASVRSTPCEALATNRKNRDSFQGWPAVSVCLPLR